MLRGECTDHVLFGSIIHVGFIVLAAVGVISIYFSANRARRDAQLARSQAEMVQFNERRAAQSNWPSPGPMMNTDTRADRPIGEQLAV
jgi:hypothetical protein